MKFLSSLRFDVTVAFLAVMLASGINYFPVTAVIAVFVSVLAQRWGTPPGSSFRALAVRVCFFLSLWVSGGACGSLLRAGVFEQVGTLPTIVALVLVVALAPLALRFLSGRVNSWWAPMPPTSVA